MLSLSLSGPAYIQNHFSWHDFCICELGNMYMLHMNYVFTCECVSKRLKNVCWTNSNLRRDRRIIFFYKENRYKQKKLLSLSTVLSLYFSLSVHVGIFLWKTSWFLFVYSTYTVIVHFGCVQTVLRTLVFTVHLNDFFFIFIQHS